MNLKIFEQFRNALQETLSPNDEEALSAVRRANAILLADNKSWKELLAGKVSVTMSVLEGHPNQVQAYVKGGQKVKATDEEIEYWFEEVLTGRNSPGFRSFLESLYEQWGKSHRLTSEQIRCLKEAYEHANEPKSFSGRRD